MTRRQLILDIIQQWMITTANNTEGWEQPYVRVEIRSNEEYRVFVDGSLDLMDLATKLDARL